MLVQDFLENSAARLPDKVCLVCDGQRLTYAEVDAMANRLANALQARGLRRGDRAVMFLPNSVEAVVGVFAVLKAGGVFVVVNHSTKEHKLAYILNNCQASALITSGRNHTMAARVATEAPSLHTIVLTGRLPEAAGAGDVLSYDQVQQDPGATVTRPARVSIDLDLACLIYTSGSTGEPKGVMSDHSNVVFAAGSIIEYLGNVEDDSSSACCRSRSTTGSTSC